MSSEAEQIFRGTVPQNVEAAQERLRTLMVRRFSTLHDVNKLRKEIEKHSRLLDYMRRHERSQRRKKPRKSA